MVIAKQQHPDDLAQCTSKIQASVPKAFLQTQRAKKASEAKNIKYQRKKQKREEQMAAVAAAQSSNADSNILATKNDPAHQNHCNGRNMDWMKEQQNYPSNNDWYFKIPEPIKEIYIRVRHLERSNLLAVVTDDTDNSKDLSFEMTHSGVDFFDRSGILKFQSLLLGQFHCSFIQSMFTLLQWFQ